VAVTTGRTPAPQRSYGGRSAEERRIERRERLLAAGLELFGNRGYAQTSIERLCTTAGVSTRNFYEEFTGRESLLTALHLRINDRCRTAVAEAFAEVYDEPMPVRAERAVRAYIENSAGDPRVARISYVEVIGVSPEMERHRLEWREHWSKDLLTMIEDAVARGEAIDRDYGLTTMAIIGAANNLVHHWSARGDEVPLDKLAAELTRMIVALVTV
jgi:AcrR family transcriptional regulator